MINVQDQLFYITTNHFSLILAQEEGNVFVEHCGARVDSYHYANQVYRRDYAFSGGPHAHDRTFSMDTQRHLLGQSGNGDFRRPSILIQHTNNEITNFKLKGYEILDHQAQVQGLPQPHAKDDQPLQTLVLHFEDQVAQLGLDIFYTPYPEMDTIATFSRLTNLSQVPVQIQRLLSQQIDLPNDTYDVLTFQGAYGREKTLRRQPVTQGIFMIESNRGASGHAQTPSLILAHRTTTERAGEALAMQLMYSGNFQAFVQENQLGEVRVGIGIGDQHFTWPLKAQDTFDSPVALMTYSSQGLSGLTHLSHQFVQDHILPKPFAHNLRPILINNWEATYFDFKKDKLLDLADHAADLGIELFVLDDGWFGTRDSDNESLGDWYVNEQKLGGSLGALIAAVHDKGLKFGIWVEPEMISENSDLYRAHPDWAIQAPKRPHTYSRNQLVLDLSNPQVVTYIIQWLDSLLSSHEIDYVKWDMNRNISNIGNGQDLSMTLMQSHAYMLGLYRILDTITNKHPHVLFESCSGGGGRNDLGMMAYFSQVWASDNTDAIDRLVIQEGSSYLYPTITMGAHVSAVPNHQVGRLTPLETRGRVAMMGNLGYELDLTSLTQEELSQIKDQVANYKTIRHIVQLGTLYRLLPAGQGHNATAVQYVYGQESLVTFVRVLSTLSQMDPRLKLQGLQPDALYEIVGQDKIYSGVELMYAGLTIALPAGDYLSMQIHLRQVSQ